MSEAEEVLACDRFMSDVVNFILPIDQRLWAVPYHALD